MSDSDTVAVSLTDSVEINPSDTLSVMVIVSKSPLITKMICIKIASVTVTVSSRVSIETIPVVTDSVIVTVSETETVETIPVVTDSVIVTVSETEGTSVGIRTLVFSVAAIESKTLIVGMSIVITTVTDSVIVTVSETETIETIPMVTDSVIVIESNTDGA